MFAVQGFRVIMLSGDGPARTICEVACPSRACV